jgi:CRISPR/Cas system CSM-associated protein Csm3 (group 7 of RAMP superfamily)
MSNTHYNLRFDIQSYWHVGSGRCRGVLEALVHKNPAGLPFLPGRTVKGLLRDAVYRAEQWGHIPPKTTHCFFGSEAVEKDRALFETEAGALGVSDAVLPTDIETWLSHPAINPQLRQVLFQQLSANTIDPATGSANPQSLRTIEVAIPLPLTARLEVIQPTRLDNWEQGRKHWIDCLKPCLSLIRAIGSSRSRGLGRVSVTLEEEKSVQSIG